MIPMIGYKYNDGGRAAAGYKGSTGDCLVRAIAIVTELPYKEVYKFVADTMGEYGFTRSGNAYTARKGRKPGYRKVYGKTVQDNILKRLGFVKVKLPKGPRPSYTTAYETYGDCLVTTMKHISAIKDGHLQDTGDIRTYNFTREIWEDVGGGMRKQTFRKLAGERKAMSVWVLAN